MASRNGQPTLLGTLLTDLRMFLFLLLAYLLQVSVIPYLRIGGIAPSLIIVMIAIVTVAYGKLRAFWAGAFFGIILEAMQPTTALLNLMLYPISAILCSVVFSNKSAQQLDYERSIGRAGRNITPFLRTPVCAFTLTFIYDLVNIAYIYLRGSSINGIHIARGLLDIFLTTLLCCILMMPVRRMLGVHEEAAESDDPQPYLGKPNR